MSAPPKTSFGTPPGDLNSIPPVILGMWPMAGVTTVGVTEAENAATMRAAVEAGIRVFDTAFSYGHDGESDRLLGRWVARNRSHFRVHGKVGQRWTADRKRVVDGSPNQLVRDAETSLRRIGVEAFDLLMLHSVDPDVPIERSAEAIDSLRRRGLARAVGVCNVTSQELERFCETTECAAIQCPLNLLQQDATDALIPRCQTRGIDVHVYWTLMKGLLAGKIRRGHVFSPGDSRPNYEIFQGTRFAAAMSLVDRLDAIAREQTRTVANTASAQPRDCSIAELAVAWALSQPGVSAAVVGARRPDQVKQTAYARPLDPDTLRAIDAAKTDSTKT